MHRSLARCASLLYAMALAARAAAAPFDVLDSERDIVDLDLPAAIAPSPDGRHVYVCASNSSTLVGFAVDGATGALTKIDVEPSAGEIIGGLAGCPDLEISPDGRFVYTVGRNDWGIGIFSRDTETGLLTYLDVLATKELAEQDALQTPTAITTSPNGDFLYVTLRLPDAVTVLARNSATGLLSLVEVERNPPGWFLAAPRSVTVSADGAFVYVVADGELVGDTYADALITFARDATTGEISLVDTDREGLGLAFPLLVPVAVETTRDGRDIYVAASDINAIVAFHRTTSANPTQYASFVNNTSPGLGSLLAPTSLAITRDGQYVLATALAGDALLVLQRDAVTGALLAERAVVDDATTWLDGPEAVALDPRGRFVYVAARNDDALTVLAPEPGVAGCGAAAVAALALRRRTRRSRRS